MGARRAANAVIAVTCVLAVASCSQRAATRTTTTAPPRTTTTVVACPHVVRGLSFVSSLDGYALVDDCAAGGALDASVDGGKTWHRLSRFASLHAGIPANAVAFTSRLDGAVATSDAIVWVTSDGGHSWAELHLAGTVTQLFAAGGRDWAVTVSACGAAGCPESVRPLSTAGAGVARPLPPAMPSVATAPGVWAVAETDRLWVSGNDGVSWTRLPFGFRCGEPILGPSSRQDLWMLCNDAMGSGAEAKSLYRSHDGGAVWTLVAQAAAFDITRRVGSLGATGYALQLVALSPQTALLEFGYALVGVQLSTDGGTSWHWVTAGLSHGTPTVGVVCVSPRSCWSTSGNSVLRSSRTLSDWSGAELS